MHVGLFLLTVGTLILAVLAVSYLLNRSFAEHARQVTIALTQNADVFRKQFEALAGDDAVSRKIDVLNARIEEAAVAHSNLSRNLTNLDDRFQSHMQRYYRLQREESTPADPEEAARQELEQMIQASNNPARIGVPRRYT